MKCAKCGSELRFGNEQVGIDQNGIPIFHRFAYCDSCMLKNDMDEQIANNKKKSERNRRKKTLSAILSIVGVVALVVIILGKYGGEDNNTYQEKETISDGEADTERQEDMTEKNEDKKTNPEYTIFDPQEVYNANNCIISVIEGNEKGIAFEIQNNSEKDYGFDVHALSINGIMTNCNIYTMDTDVPSGKKSKAILDISDYTKDFAEVEYVEILFWVYDNAKSYKDFETEIIRINGNSCADGIYHLNFEQKHETNGLEICLEKLEREKLILYVTNKNEYYVDIDISNISFNDWAYNTDYEFSLMDIEIFPGSQAKIEMDINSDFIENNSIDVISDCEFSIKFRKYGDYFQETETEKIIFKNE